MNAFDEFDSPQGNAFDEFDAPAAAAEPAPKGPFTPGLRNIAPPTPFEEIAAKVQIPGWMQTLISRGRSFAQGAADPVVGGVQLAANAVGMGDGVNKAVADQEKDYQSQRFGDGFDGGRVVGNIASPVNLLAASRIPLAASTMGRVAQGAALGAAGGALEPVADTRQGFWQPKGEQVMTGALAGAVLSPLLGKVGDAVINKLNARGVTPTQADIDAGIAQAVAELGQKVDDVPVDQLASLRTQVGTALKTGKRLDPAAAMRKSDFDAMGLKPTLGQITRDPNQFAREQNLRGVEGLGEPLMARFQEQGNKLQDALSARATGAKDAYSAGTQLRDSLANTDEMLRKQISAMYGEARQSAGKDLDIPLQGLAQDYAAVLTDFGDKVPGAIRSKFAALGLDPSMPSNQKRLFTMQDADALLKNINDLDPGFADKATSTALSRIRQAVRGAVTTADPSGGPFAPAVRAAAERFKMQDAIPALKAASRGTVAPDDFVQRFIINGKTDEVKGLAGVLRQSDPAAWEEARAQIGETLMRAAFGDARAGNDSFAAARYMMQLKRLGTAKLAAFFSPDEVAEIMRIGRVGTYINRAPNASAVNRSNSASAIANLVSNIPGISPVAGVVKSVAGTVKNQATVRNALKANLPVTNAAAPMSPRQRNYLAYLMAAGGLGVGGLAAGSVAE